MRKVFVLCAAGAVLGAAVSGCSAAPTQGQGGSEGGETKAVTPATPGETPASTVYTFEGMVDPVHDTMMIAFRSPTGELIAEPTATEAKNQSGEVHEDVQPDSVCGPTFQTLPYTTSGSAGVYLHTLSATGLWNPTDLAVEAQVCPMNLYLGFVCTYTAVINAISDSSVGLLQTPKTGATGTASMWSCSNGTPSASNPGVPPCTQVYGTIFHTGSLCTGTTARNWVFNDPNQVSFTFSGIVEGYKPAS